MIKNDGISFISQNLTNLEFLENLVLKFNNNDIGDEGAI